jgi:hypothetical protein
MMVTLSANVNASIKTAARAVMPKAWNAGVRKAALVKWEE